MSPANLPIAEAFTQPEPEYADTIRTFKIGKRTVSLRLYKNGKIRRFLSSSKGVKEKCGRDTTYRFNDEMEALHNISLDNAVILTRKELRKLSQKDNVELRQHLKAAKNSEAVKADEVIAESVIEAPVTNTQPKSPIKSIVSEKDLSAKKLKGQGKLLFCGIADQTRRDKDSNRVETYSCFCIDIEDKESKATERLQGADLERALTDANANIGDQVEVYLMAVKKTGDARAKNLYEIRVIK